MRHRSLKDGLLNEEVRFSTMIKLRHLLLFTENLTNGGLIKGEGKNYEVPQKCNFFQNSF